MSSNTYTCQTFVYNDTTHHQVMAFIKTFIRQCGALLRMEVYNNSLIDLQLSRDIYFLKFIIIHNENRIMELINYY